MKLCGCRSERCNEFRIVVSIGLDTSLVLFCVLLINSENDAEGNEKKEKL